MVTKDSKALQYVESKGWPHRVNEDQIVLETCPVCNKDNWHFYIAATGEKDGLWNCFVCTQNGNLRQLKEYLGDRLEDHVSMKEAAGAGRTPDPLPNVEATQRRLMSEAADENVEESALDYLLTTRGLTMAAIEKFKLGLVEERGKRWLVIPYFNGEKCVFAKYRTLPPDEKDFRCPAGREVPLFNQSCIAREMDELIFTEGEMDCMTLVSHGLEHTVGVPGANVKKAVWIKMLDEMAPKRIYLLYDNDKIGQDAARVMADRIGIDKVWNIVLPSLVNGVEIKDINEFFQAGGTIEELDALKLTAKAFNVEGIFSAVEVIAEIRADIEKNGSLKPKYGSPWPELDLLIGGADDGDMIGVLAEGKIGKMSRYDAGVLTPTGWTTVGELSVGQALASVDGEPSQVVGIFPQGKKREYRVTFSDGRSTVVGNGHLWKVGNVDNFTRDGYRVVDTLQLAKLAEKSSWFVPLFSGQFGVDAGISIDPWLLGALIGDGGMTCGLDITKTDKVFINAVRESVEAAGCSLIAKDHKTYRITGRNRDGRNYLLQNMRWLGLHGHKSVDKFIPEQHKTASREVRLALLQGLMDSDGSCEGLYNVPVFNTSSVQLANDVQYLVRSLGGIAAIGTRQPQFQHKGEMKLGYNAYRVYIKLKDRVFLHSEKASRVGTPTRSARLTVTSIKPEGEAEMVCIAVSHSSKLYITDDFIVTHNTTLGMNWLDYLVSEYHESGLMYCQEMNPKRVVKKWISYITDTPQDDITLASVDQALSVAAGRDADLLFGYTKHLVFKEVANTIRQAVRRYGVKFVCFDNLQLLCRNIEHNAQETSAICKGFKNLTMELGVFMILIIQPNRVAEGQIVASRNAHGSSAIEKDVDAMVCLHRNREGKIKQEDFDSMGSYLDVPENFQPQMLVRADLTRYAAGGATTLWMEGAKSKIISFPKDALAVRGAMTPTMQPQRLEAA